MTEPGYRGDPYNRPARFPSEWNTPSGHSHPYDYGQQPSFLPPGPPTSGSRVGFYVNVAAAVVTSIGIIVGSIGPWATFIELTKYGVEGDGIFTLVLGSLALVVLFVLLNLGDKAGFGVPWAVPILGVLSATVAIFDGVNLMNVITRTSSEGSFEGIFNIQLGWGLWTVMVCSVGLCLAATATAVQIDAMRSGGDSSFRLGNWLLAMLVEVGVIAFGVMVALRFLPADFDDDLDSTADRGSASTPTASAPLRPQPSFQLPRADSTVPTDTARARPFPGPMPRDSSASPTRAAIPPILRWP